MAEKAKPAVTVWLRRRGLTDDSAPGNVRWNHEVHKTQNTIKPAVSDILGPEEVEALIDAGVTVNVTA